MCGYEIIAKEIHLGDIRVEKIHIGNGLNWGQRTVGLKVLLNKLLAVNSWLS